MRTVSRAIFTCGLALTVPMATLVGQADTEAKIENALSAAPPDLAAAATVRDWEGNVLKAGTNAYTCLPTPPNLPGNAPMCLDGAWLEWAQAWQNKTEPMLSGTGVAYMLAGDAGASNTDPYATEKTATNDWVEAGPHLMIIVPDPGMLQGITTDHSRGVPWVMWRGTPYAHIMVPVGRQHGGH